MTHLGLSPIKCPFALPQGARAYLKDPSVVDTEASRRWRITFPNGWEASVVKFWLSLAKSFGDVLSKGETFAGSYGADRGLWELAVIDPEGNLDGFNPAVDVGAPVTGFLSEAAVSEILVKIAAITDESLEAWRTVRRLADPTEAQEDD